MLLVLSFGFERLCKPKGGTFMHNKLNDSKCKLKIFQSGDPQTRFRYQSSSEILKALPPPWRLLSGSAKLDKCQSVGVLARVLYFTPGIFCPGATTGCRASCLGHTSGRMQFQTHSEARDARAALFREQPQLFLRRLRAELTLLEIDALLLHLRPAVRLNGTSDLSWERLCPELFADYPDVQFFDYTKLHKRMLDFLDSTFPANYRLTFSVDEKNSDKAASVLNRGGTVAAVFWPELPETWWGFPVIDGDSHDARFLDPAGVVVGLKAKGLARVDVHGFTIRPCLRCGAAAKPMDLMSCQEDTHRTTIHQCKNCRATVTARWLLPRIANPRHNAA
jgi:hypothetical protein